MEKFEAISQWDGTLNVSGPEAYPDKTPYYSVVINTPSGDKVGIPLSIEQAHALKYYLIEQLGQ
jgi:hypothetical protein